MTRTRAYLILIFVFNLFIVIATSFECSKTPSDKPTSLKIKEHILCDYDTSIRPVLDNSAVMIKMAIFVHHFDFSEHSNTIDVSAWVGLKWSDEHLTWNLKDFNNYESIMVSTDDIWTPDISIYNGGPYADTELIQETSECLLTYYNKVTCLTPTEMQGMCWPDLRYWPFDVQNCTIRIGSWYHTGEEININETEYIEDNSDKSRLHENPDWKLESGKIIIDKGIYKRHPNNTFPTVKLQMLIRRRASAKIVFVVIPYLALISMTILMAYLEPKHCERIYIATLSIPCHIMYLLNSTWDLPETADTIPYLIILLRNSQFLATFTLIETITVRWLLNKTSESPRWLLLIFSYVATNKFAQLLLFSEISPENAAENVTADDSANLVEFKEEPKEWYLLGRVLDRLYFWFLITFCLIMFIVCIPK